MAVRSVCRSAQPMARVVDLVRARPAHSRSPPTTDVCDGKLTLASASTSFVFRARVDTPDRFAPSIQILVKRRVQGGNTM